MIPSNLEKDRTHKASWLKSLAALGMRAQIETIEEMEGPDGLASAERFWISQFRALGFKLTNHTDGGDGMHGFSPSVETRRKLSVATKGRARPEEVRRHISEGKTGKRFSVEHCRAMSTARGGRPFADETGAVYHTYAEAATALGISWKNIPSVLRGQRHTAGGHTFKYLE
jgi:hypothetical protein